MNRVQALKKMRTAFKQGKLSAQNGATSCKYYDKETDSHCVVGVLIGYKENLVNSKGDICSPFKHDEFDNGIDGAMHRAKKETYCGLLKSELSKLQSLHDNIISYKHEFGANREQQLENYLFELPKKLGGV